jgi:predicted small lipoprotein YifL
MNNRYRTLAALILGLIFVAACGQKGPLYLPGNPSEIKTEVPGQDQGQSEEDDKDKEKNSQHEN